MIIANSRVCLNLVQIICHPHSVSTLEGETLIGYQNNTSKTDVAPWCYKWVDGWIGMNWYLRVVVGREHLTMLIRRTRKAEDISYFLL